MKLTVTDDLCPMHARVLQQIVAERAENIPGEMTVSLRVDRCGKDSDGYRISGQGDQWEIIGYGERGLYYGIGKFLHSARWSETAFEPQPTNGDIMPASPFRAMYYSIHFYNWYQQAPEEELENYLTSLLLWGYNIIFLIVPVINLSSVEEPLFFKTVNRARRVFELCHKYGMETGIIMGSQGLKSAPHEYDAELTFDPRNRGYLGRNLCVSKPAAMEYLKTLWAQMLNAFSDTGLDYIMAWPYDEGGCGCAKCRPWGAVGFCKMFGEMVKVGKEIYPQAKYVLSTWGFDTVIDEGEFAGLYEKLRSGAVKTDYIMIDHHQEFPIYPLEHPPIVPAVNFPEISMWGLYPWGGYGANPLPRRFERLFRRARPILHGGMPYSEGIYEDISKVQWVGYYWQPDRNYADIISEYAGYYYPGADAAEIVRLCELIEQNHAGAYTGEKPDTAAYRTAAAIATAQNDKICPAAADWRWRILYIRAMLDQKRYAYYEAHKSEENLTPDDLVRYAGSMLKNDAEAQALFRELCGFYHCVDYNGENRWTHPPVNGGDGVRHISNTVPPPKK